MVLFDTLNRVVLTWVARRGSCTTGSTKTYFFPPSFSMFHCFGSSPCTCSRPSTLGVFPSLISQARAHTLSPRLCLSISPFTHSTAFFFFFFLLLLQHLWHLNRPLSLLSPSSPNA